MAYFKNFKFVPYQFGKSAEIALHQNISSYVELLDKVKNNTAFYRKYTILDGDRPDNVSQTLYGSPKHYWTFFLLNDGIREQGWPLTIQKIREKAIKEKPNTVITTNDDITLTFKSGSTVTGLTSGTTGTILKRNLELGQIIIEGNKSFLDGENLRTIENSVTSTIGVVGSVEEYNSIHHYEDSDGNYVDINPYEEPGSLLLPVTQMDRYINSNDDLKDIIVIKPDIIETIYEEFQLLMSSY